MDSVSLADAAAPPGRLNVGNVKVLVALFVLFLIIVSEPFVAGVIAGFGDKAVRGRAPTAWGVALQGIFLVIFYILAVYLIDRGFL